MINNNQAIQTESSNYDDWTQAYIDLSEDELLKLYVLSLRCDQAGQRLLELSRRIWHEQRLIAPYDVALFQTELRLGRN